MGIDTGLHCKEEEDRSLFSSEKKRGVKENTGKPMMFPLSIEL